MSNYINPNPKKVSDADLKAALKKAAIKYDSYEGFVGTLQIILNTDRMSREEERQLYQDTYVLYKEQNEANVVQWALQHFHHEEVNKDSHDFWIDKRGIMLYHLPSRML